jgi:hypothetical protein
MPFSIRPSRRFPVCCPVTYHCGLFEGHGTVWNLSLTSWRFTGDVLMRPGETVSLTVRLPNEQRIEMPEAVVRWSRGPGGRTPPLPQSPSESNHQSLNTHPH